MSKLIELPNSGKHVKASDIRVIHGLYYDTFLTPQQFTFGIAVRRMKMDGTYTLDDVKIHTGVVDKTDQETAQKQIDDFVSLVNCNL